MVLRSIVCTHLQSDVGRGLQPLGKYTFYAFIFAMICAGWLGFKQVEPMWLPVIKDFKIEDVVGNDEHVAIAGTFDKVRDCDLLDFIAYSGNRFIHVKTAEHPNSAGLPPARLVRSQTYGPWLLIPRVPELEIYAKHRCMTGMVTTRLFKGAIIITDRG